MVINLAAVDAQYFLLCETAHVCVVFCSETRCTRQFELVEDGKTWFLWQAYLIKTVVFLIGLVISYFYVHFFSIIFHILQLHDHQISHPFVKITYVVAPQNYRWLQKQHCTTNKDCQLCNRAQDFLKFQIRSSALYNANVLT